MHVNWMTAMALTAVATLAMTEDAAAETLDDAWRLATGADQRLVAAQARTEAADAEVEAARAGRRPNMTATTATSRWSDTPTFDFAAAGLPIAVPLFGGQSVNIADARVSVPVYNGGAGRQRHRGHCRTNPERMPHRAPRRRKTSRCGRLAGVLRATSAFVVARCRAPAASARATSTTERSGEVANNDYLAAAVHWLMPPARAASRPRPAVAAASYNRHVGRPLDTPVTLELNAPLDGALAAQTLPERSSARAARVELASLDAAASAWLARADAVVRAPPQLTVSGGYTYLENTVLREQDYWSLTLGVRWSPFDSGRTRHEKTALTRQSAATAAERNDLATAIELDVRRAWHARDAARARIGVATRAVQQAEENLRVVRDRYRNGEGTNTEVPDAESLWTSSISNLDTARYDARLAELTLAHAVGNL
jgi:outer membrane protein TolC